MGAGRDRRCERRRPDAHQVPPAPGRPHKIFLGYAAGVGKTYTMLAEAHRRLERGEDVVAAYVEPHARPATMALLEGLEQLSVKRFAYRGAILAEMDTAAVLRRHPQVALVDELAHTNAPGAEHAKRWQSVLDLLAAGISVISTVNVQHLESANDAVFEITGVRVQETLPDLLLHQADEVVLADLTVEALHNRLRRGAIYAPEKITQSLESFFREGNLLALRELALRTAAERLDESLEDYLERHRIRDAWRSEERVLVCITPTERATRLVRHAARLARRLGSSFWTVHIRTPDCAPRLPSRRSLRRPSRSVETWAARSSTSTGSRRQVRSCDSPMSCGRHASSSANRIVRNLRSSAAR